MTSNFSSTIGGTPRIGLHRELKFALEGYWSGNVSGRELSTTAMRLVNNYSDHLNTAGLDSIPTIGRSYYDSMLDTSALLGILPTQVSTIPDHENDGLPQFIDRYFATARGTKDIPASAMTKWFDTNYHYIIPELSETTEFILDDAAFLNDVRDQQTRGIDVRPILIGPLTFLSLSHTTDGSNPLDHLESVFAAYERLGAKITTEWLQFDEPSLVTDIEPEVLKRVRNGYEKLAKSLPNALFVNTFFGAGDTAVDTLAGIGLAAIGVDLVTNGVTELAAWQGEELLVAGIVDGRNIWRSDLHAALETLQTLHARGPVAVSTSCSLLHVPYSLAIETSLDNDPELRSWLAFGEEKITEVIALANALAGTVEQEFFDASARATESRRVSERTKQQDRIIPEAQRQRVDYENRRKAQESALNLPELPTTTIGSFPQTREIRTARTRLRRGDITPTAYNQAMEAEIATIITRQLDLDLDVLVHGEPERNDMVQYFSEQLDGYHSSQNAWVQSYGSRCVRPPILYGNISRPQPMTTHWFSYAQSLTEKPVKGMLTGPVTMLAWSFVRDDQPLSTTADQIALVLRDEITDLIAAGARIIQVDEPAIRELLPLKAEHRPTYTQWAVGAFKLATAGAPEQIQIHTHMCYSQFNELIDTIIDLDADVTTIEAARSDMRVLKALKSSGFKMGVGPGMWDIHSPRVPTKQEVSEKISAALESVSPDRLWINPDCGLKTRKWAETIASLTVLVDAAQQARTTIAATDTQP